jgi:DNA polymerase
MPILFRDYETRSTLNLGDVGAWRYASDSSTDVWCCAYCVDDGEIKLWVPNKPVPHEFITAAENPDWLAVAFNDGFEHQIETHVMSPRYSWPLVPIDRHRCLQASALALALPGSLDGVASALKLEQQKDTAGHHTMMQMAKPRRSRKDEDPKQIYWFDDSDRRERLYTYCRQDVATERELYQRIGFLPDDEQALWLLDCIINNRGIHIDRRLLDAAIGITGNAQSSISAEITKITEGAVETVHQVARMLDWLATHDCKISNLRKPTLEQVLARQELPPATRRALELRLDGAHAAVAKLSTMRDWLPPDDPARGCFKFHGAATGRWTSHGIQVQNLKRPVVENLDAAIEAVYAGDLGKYPRPMSVVGDITRALICAQPGHRFIAADFSGVESRITAWLSGQGTKLAQWTKFDQTQNPEDEPYYLIGRNIFGIAKENARAIGKTADLAFGYMGGIGAYRKLAPGDNSTDEQIKARQYAWRDAHPLTRDFWTVLNRKTVQAVSTPGAEIRFQRFSWQHLSFKSDGTFLRMILPSGRAIAYPFPTLKKDNHGKPCVVFMDNAAGKWAECRGGNGAYGGTWLENAVQGVGRDLFAAAMQRLEAAGYKIVLHVHDEIVAEVPEDFGSTEEFLRILVAPPAWATGLRVAAKVRNGPRFCKSSKPAVEAPQFNSEPQQPATEEPEVDNANEARTNEYQSHDSRSNSDGYNHGEQDTGRQIAFFIYHHADCRPYLGVKKTSTKQFPQYHWTDNKWKKGAPAGPKIPYRLPELIKAPLDVWVAICAGEKDAETAATLGFIATTNPEGERKGAWAAELNAWFYGRRVAIMEDNDDTGRTHVIEVADALRGKASDIRIVTFRDLDIHGDLTDWADAGGSYTGLLTKIETTKPYCYKPQPAPIRQWDGKPIPELEYAVPDRFPLENVGLFSGEGGQGKSSLLQQLCVAHAIGSEWLGCKPVQRPSIYIECEDSERVLRWRLTAIAAHYKVTLTTIADAGFQMFPLTDEESAILALAPDKSGIVRPSPLYDWLYELAGDIKPIMIGIASSANVFAGNENVRTEVQQFIRLLRRIACVAGGSVILVTQPSLSGIDHKSASHEGLAGTTQWHNAVRARAVIASIKHENGIDTGLRQIKFRKNQYGPESAGCFVRYDNGLFLPVEGMSLDVAERATKADEVFLNLLKKFTAQGQKVSPNKSNTYAPSRFSEHPEALGISKDELKRAMQRLLDAGVIKVESGPRSSWIALVEEE